MLHFTNLSVSEGFVLS